MVPDNKTAINVTISKSFALKDIFLRNNLLSLCLYLCINILSATPFEQRIVNFFVLYKNVFVCGKEEYNILSSLERFEENKDL